jgi:hypothetical protein
MYVSLLVQMPINHFVHLPIRPVYLSTCSFVCLFICQSVYPSVHLSVFFTSVHFSINTCVNLYFFYQIICPSDGQSVCLCVYLLYSLSLCCLSVHHICLSVRLSISNKLSVHLMVNLSVCLIVCLPIYYTVCRSVLLYVCTSHLSVCASVHFSIKLSVHLMVNLSVCLLVCVSVYYTVCLSDLCLSFYPFVCLCIRPYCIEDSNRNFSAIPLTGPFVTMIYSMILGDMTTFSIIYIIFLFGFSQVPLNFFFIIKWKK